MDKPLYNSLIIKTYLEYLKNDYPEMNFSKLLDYAGIAHDELEDRGHWLNQSQVNRFHDYVDRVTGNADIARQAGRYIASRKSTASAVLRQTMAGFLSPAMAYWALEKVTPTVTHHQNVKGRRLAANQYEIIVTTKPGLKEELFQCQNRQGMYEAIAEIFTGKYATVEHPDCQHRGAPHCRYIISWETPASLIWRRIGAYSLTATALATIVLLFVAPFYTWFVAVLSACLISTGFLLAASMLRNREMAANLTEQGKTSEEIITQINRRYNESVLIREIGEAVSTLFDPPDLLSYVLEALHQRLSFQRSLAMLAHPEQTHLVYAASHGFTPYEDALLRNLTFSLTTPDKGGSFYQAYMTQKPVITDGNEISSAQLSQKSENLIKDLGVSSFICVPIVYQKKTEGVVAIDISRLAGPPTHSDLSLLVGIAQQIGVGLNNIQAHKQLKDSEARFRNLSENAPDMIYQLDQEGRIQYVNPAWNEMLGHRPDDLKGKYLREFLPPQDAEAFFEIFVSILRNGSKMRNQYFTIFNRLDQPCRIVLAGAPHTDSDGRVIGVVGTLKVVSQTSVNPMQAPSAISEIPE